MNRTKKFFLNSISAAAFQIVVMLSGFITPRVILSVYGSEINGLVSSLVQFINYFNLVEAGLAGAAVYALYRPLAERDIGGISGIVSAAKKFYNLSGLLFVGLTMGLAVVYPLVGSPVEGLTKLDIALLVLVLGAAGALEFFTMAKYRVILTADQRVYVVSLASMASTILNTVLIVVLAGVRIPIVWLRVVVLSCVFLRSAILYLYTKKHYPDIDYAAKPNVEALNKRWDALYLQVLGAIQTGAPIVLTTLFVGYKEVSVYTIFYMVIGGIDGILSIFISGLSSSFGDIIARGEKKTLQDTYRQFEYSYYALITLVYTCAMTLIMPFIRIYTRGITDANYDLPLIGFLIVLNGFLYNLKTPQGMLVISAGMYRETKLQTTIQGVIAVGGGMLLAPRFGLAGILCASIAANLYRDFDLLCFIPPRVTGLKISQTAIRWVGVLFQCAVIVLPLSFFTIAPDGYLEWAVYACGISGYAGIVILAFGLIFERKEIKNLLQSVLSLASKK